MRAMKIASLKSRRDSMGRLGVESYPINTLSTLLGEYTLLIAQQH